MDNETIDLNPDYLKRMEDQLRSTGAWADFKGSRGIGHFFIARNPSINTAISLCRESIQTFDNLTLTVLPQKCFVCSLLSNQRLKEVQEKVNKREEEVAQELKKERKQLTLF